MAPNYPGAIASEDVASGSFDHALAPLIPANMLRRSFTGPALAIDSNPNHSGAVPMGSRFAIPASVDLNSLGLKTAMGWMEAEATQKYGACVTAASRYEPEGGPLSSHSWERQQDLMAIFHAAQLTVPDRVTIA